MTRRERTQERLVRIPEKIEHQSLVTADAGGDWLQHLQARSATPCQVAQALEGVRATDRGR